MYFGYDPTILPRQIMKLTKRFKTSSNIRLHKITTLMMSLDLFQESLDAAKYAYL